MAKYRALLGLDKDESDNDSDEDVQWAIQGMWKRKTDHAGTDMKITFNSAFDDIHERVQSKKQRDADLKKESSWQKYNWERKERKRTKKQETKRKREEDRKEATKEELELIMGKDTKDDFEASTTDDRFWKVGSGAYRLDPTHQDYSKVGEKFKEFQRKRKK